MKIDIESLSLRELNSLLAAAEQRKKLLGTRRPLAVVRKELTAFAVSQGYAIEEFVEFHPASPVAKHSRRPRKRLKVPAKYRDPNNKRNTWSGRGRMPRWLADRTKRGQSATDFLIPGLGQPTAKKSGTIGRKSVFKQGGGPGT
ncbi:H-NS family nucleoid-associated regulatory protein [Lysobacter korlensis]|uniref:H-NS family nucleoid-associated regulatory protein n=1 Tax=Lysobacter korlensis TaxID=553636 RepID=A0ABV6S011_9GAMM